MEHQDQWTCCSVRNKEEIKYFIQCGFGLLVIGFSILQIVTHDDDRNVWVSLLSGTLGLFLPHPTMK